MKNKTFVPALLLMSAIAVPATARAQASPDAKTILEEAGKALLAVDSLSFNAEITPQGAAAQSVPHVKGTVVQSRIKRGLKMNVKGSFEKGSNGWEDFHVVTDGKEISSLNSDKKEVVTGRLPAAGGLMDPGFFIVMQRMASTDPFEQEVDEALKLEKDESVGGVDCHVVHVTYDDKEAGTARLFIAKSDRLLRRIDRTRGTGADAGSVSLVATEVKANPPTSDETFTMALPDGFKRVKYKAPANGRPALIEEGEAAPDWTLKTPEGKEVSLKKDLAGKVVLIDFWATWCGPCKMVMPDIQKLHEHFKDNKNVAIYGISTWERGGDPAGYMKGQKFTYGLLVKGEKAAEAYKVQGIPTIYVIGKDGKVVFAESGAAPDLAKTMTDIINEALDE